MMNTMLDRKLLHFHEVQNKRTALYEDRSNYAMFTDWAVIISTISEIDSEATRQHTKWNIQI